MESSNNEKTVYLINLLAFMNKDYLAETLQSFKVIKEIKVENNIYGLPGI